MNDFELRYNSVEQAYFVILQELVKSVAQLHEGDPKKWINEFEANVCRKIEEAKNQDGTSRDPRLTEVAKTVVQAVSQMAAYKL